MMILKKVWWVVLAGVFLCSSFTFAGNVDTFGIGAKATSLGGAVCATADDPFAAYYNPAGLTQLKKSVFSAGIHIIDPTLEVYNFEVVHDNDPQVRGPVSFSDESDNLMVPSVGFAMPISDSFAAGIAAYVPYGLKVRFSNDPNSNPTAYNGYDEYYIREAVTPTVAFKVSDKLSVGVGVSIGKAKFGHRQKIYITNDLGNHPTYGPMISNGVQQQLNATFTAAGIPSTAPLSAPAGTGATIGQTIVGGLGMNPSFAPYATQIATAVGNLDSSATAADAYKAVGDLYLDGVPATDHGSELVLDGEDNLNYSYNIGILYKPSPKLALGATYRSRAKVEFDGDIIYEENRVAGFTSQIDCPEQVQLGFKLYPLNDITFEFDMVWTNWSIIESNVLVADQPVTVNVIPGTYDATLQDLVKPRNWKDTRQIRIGLEWKASDMVTLRGGYFYDPSPIPDKTFDFEWPDADKKIYSLGLGLNFGRFSIDSVLQYAVAEMDREIGGEGINLNHVFDMGDTLADQQWVRMDAGGYMWAYGMNFNLVF